MKIFFSILTILSLSLPSSAQTKFVQAGKIEFERKINVHRQFNAKEEDEWFKEYVSKLPKFYTSYHDLYFSAGKTLYKPGRDGDDIRKVMWGIGPAKENVVLTDFEKSERRSSKNVFEQTYFLQDTASQLEWRISDETRLIAGFECRKAVARICDSVYVVAFYTDEITVSGGPESFHGLPGMILGLAVPRLYTTWFATKVELVEPAAKDFNIPVKGKKVTNKELFATLQRSMEDWKEMGQKNIWWVML